MKLTDKHVGAVVKSLLTKPLYETGLDFELDKSYTDSKAVKAAVYRAYQKARIDPEKYGLSQEIIDQVAQTLKSRTPGQLRTGLANAVTLREKLDEENNKTFPELVLSGRVKAMKLLHTKLDRIAKHPKQIDETNLSTLAQTAGILFDKGQIISGEATENVAVLAKIKGDLSPEEAIDMVLKMREVYQGDKDRTNKKK